MPLEMCATLTDILSHRYTKTRAFYIGICCTRYYNAHALKTTKPHRRRLSSRLHDGKPSQTTVACGRAAGLGRRGGLQGGCSCCLSSCISHCYSAARPHYNVRHCIFALFVFPPQRVSTISLYILYILSGRSTYAVLLLRITK